MREEKIVQIHFFEFSFAEVHSTVRITFQQYINICSNINRLFELQQHRCGVQT